VNPAKGFRTGFLYGPKREKPHVSLGQAVATAARGDEPVFREPTKTEKTLPSQKLAPDLAP